MTETSSQLTGAAARLRSFVVPALLLAALELWARTAGVASDALAPPTRVVLAWLDLARDGALWQETAFTLGCALAGLAIGAGAGVLAGTLLGLSDACAKLGFLSIEVLRPIPPVALIPLAMMIFGFGWNLEIAVVAIAVFWPVLMLGKAAARQVDPGLIEVSVALEMGAAERFAKIVLPSMLPRLFTALRLGIAISMVVVISVEVSTNPRGIGHAMAIAQQSMQPDRMLAWLIWFGLLGVAINLWTLRLQRRVSARMGGQR